MVSGLPSKAITDRRPSSGRARGATFIRPIENCPFAITSPARRKSTAPRSRPRRAGVERVTASAPGGAGGEGGAPRRPGGGAGAPPPAAPVAPRQPGRGLRRVAQLGAVGEHLG